MTKVIWKKITGSNIHVWMVFLFLMYLLLIVKVFTLKNAGYNSLFSLYSIAVSIFLISRFMIAFFHNSDRKIDSNFKPTITFGIPAKDEGRNIRKTILKIAGSDYPRDKMDIITVNDGSSDNTLSEMEEAKIIVEKMGIKMTIISWEKNRGKRDGMAECVKRSNHEIIVFIDSDSFVQRDTVSELIKYFAEEKIGAVAGHAYVANADENILTKMQAVRYFISFKAFKAAESIFGAVTCCSGCCSAYRREHLIEFIDDWLNQKFLGKKCTYGDDRSLTNFLLRRGKETVFSPTAISYTVVPNNFRIFLKQQLRWKKSWTRESFNAAKFMWRKNPIASTSFYLSFILPIIAPIVVLRACVWYPLTTGNVPVFYLTGLLLISIIYGIYYMAYTRDNKWFYGAVFTIFYTLILIWQLPYAILTINDTRWGTR